MWYRVLLHYTSLVSSNGQWGFCPELCAACTGRGKHGEVFSPRVQKISSISRFRFLFMDTHISGQTHPESCFGTGKSLTHSQLWLHNFRTWVAVHFLLKTKPNKKITEILILCCHGKDYSSGSPSEEIALVVLQVIWYDFVSHIIDSS